MVGRGGGGGGGGEKERHVHRSVWIRLLKWKAMSRHQVGPDAGQAQLSLLQPRKGPGEDDHRSAHGASGKSGMIYLGQI